ncbi:MAG: MMPL family transporter, partial [Caulobacteraceae bacterium]
GAGRASRAFAALVTAASGHARLVVGAGLILGAWAIFFVLTHFSMNTSTDALLSPKLPYLQREAAFSRLFPDLDSQIVVVIDAQTPELAEEGAQALTAKLAADPATFLSVRRPDGGPFWAREGVLFQSTADVKSSMASLISAQAFLGPIAADPSLRGLTSALGTALQGVSVGQASLASLQTPLDKLSDALDKLESGRPAFFSWQALIGGEDSRALRELVLVNPKLDYSQLEPGAQASQKIRADARRLGLTAANGVSVRLTGPVPLEDEEFGSIANRALPIALVATAAIILMLWFATRSAKVIVAILFTTVIGLALAAALGLVIFGAFNVISIAFIPLFVGLGIDFGIQFSVRYRTEHRAEVPCGDALVAAGGGMGPPLTLAACAIAAGFLAFAPTAYVGVSQLGVIAGVGMMVALFLNLTLLPATIRILRCSPPMRVSRTMARMARLDAAVLGARRRVLAAFVIVAAGCAALLPLLRFDFNPMHIRNPNSESVATLLDLMHDPNYSPNTLEAARRGLPAAQALAQRLQKLPEVASARTLADFVPVDQPAKLASISDAASLLDLTFNPIAVAPAPTDEETIQSLQTTAEELSQAAAGATGAPAAA